MTPQKLIDEMEEWTRPPPGMPALAANLTHPHYVPDAARLKQVRKFQAVLNRLAFGSSSKPNRGNKKLYFFPMTEKGNSTDETHMHHHVIIEVPHQFTYEEWAAICTNRWMKIASARRSCVKIVKLESLGFHRYQLKRRDKAIFTDALSPDAMHLRSETYLS